MPTALDAILGAARLADATSAFRAALTPLNIDTFSAGEIDTAHRSRAVFTVVDWPQSWRRFERAKHRLDTHTRAELAAVAVSLGIVAM